MLAPIKRTLLNCMHARRYMYFFNIDVHKQFLFDYFQSFLKRDRNQATPAKWVFSDAHKFIRKFYIS